MGHALRNRQTLHSADVRTLNVARDGRWPRIEAIAPRIEPSDDRAEPASAASGAAADRVTPFRGFLLSFDVHPREDLKARG
jgi:hypothetical protein